MSWPELISIMTRAARVVSLEGTDEDKEVLAHEYFHAMHHAISPGMYYGTITDSKARRDTRKGKLLRYMHISFLFCGVMIKLSRNMNFYSWTSLGRDLTFGENIYILHGLM